MNPDQEQEGFAKDQAFYHILKKDQSIFEGTLKKEELSRFITQRLEL